MSSGQSPARSRHGALKVIAVFLFRVQDVLLIRTYNLDIPSIATTAIQPRLVELGEDRQSWEDAQDTISLCSINMMTDFPVPIGISTVNSSLFFNKNKFKREGIPKIVP